MATRKNTEKKKKQKITCGAAGPQGQGCVGKGEEIRGARASKQEKKLG